MARQEKRPFADKSPRYVYKREETKSSRKIGEGSSSVTTKKVYKDLEAKSKICQCNFN